MQSLLHHMPICTTLKTCTLQNMVEVQATIGPVDILRFQFCFVFFKCLPDDIEMLNLDVTYYVT